MPTDSPASIQCCCVPGCSTRATYSVTLVHADGAKDEVAACATHMHKALDTIKLPGPEAPRTWCASTD